MTASRTRRVRAGRDVARVDAGEVDQARRDCETVREADSPVPETPDDAGHGFGKA